MTLPLCRYRGGLARGEAAADPDGRTAVEVYACGKHGECTETEPRPGLAHCRGCPDHRPRVADPADPMNSVTAMTQILRGPRRDWPADWPYWGTTLDAHRHLAAEAAETLPPYPAGTYHGRGIVLLGGGAFFPGVYVTVRMLRHFGCDLPIEVWHHAATEPVEAGWLAPFGVRTVDIDDHMDRVAPSRFRGGWVSKVYAVLHARFREVLYLDSDCYPVGDVTPLFDHNPTGTVFWPDLAGSDRNIRWHAFGTGPSGRPPVQGGQFVVDKRRCWPALVLSQWYNERADFAYRYGYGDQDVLRGVWQRTGTPFTMYQPAARYDRVGFLLAGPDGARPLLVHRCNDKFRLPLAPPRCALPGAGGLYQNHSHTAEPTYQPGLPGEDLAFGYFTEFRRRWFDHVPERFRPGTDDGWIWDQVVYHNEYRLPPALRPDSVVVDVGGHIGAFAHAACRRGAGRVWVYEPVAENFARLAPNLAYWGARVTARRQAVWSHAGRVGYAPGINTGAWRSVPDGDAVDAVPIDAVLAEASAGGTRPIDVLKLDCEGAEWPILAAVRDLRMCRQVVGEYHDWPMAGHPHGVGELCRALGRHGFDVRTEPYSDHHGLFWATRGV